VTGGLDLLDELAAADEAHGRTLGMLDDLLSAVAELRARADRVAAVLTAAPAERERLAGQIAQAEEDVSDRKVALAEAETELAEAERRRDRERLLAAQRFHTRALDALAMAEKHLASAREGGLAHESAVEAAETAIPAVEEDAARLGGELARAPRIAAHAAGPPGGGLDGVQAWTTGARAALVVARSAVRAERDALIRQANELASVMLGEPQVATSVAAVARRVERSVERRA
jgi:hypothetical protein